MQTPLPREIQVIDLWPASIRLVLPRRTLGRGRWFCWGLFFAGLILLGLLLQMAGALVGGPKFILGRSLGMPVLLLAIPTVGGLIPLWWGMAGLWGRREIEVKPERLMTVERLGPFWRSKRWTLDKIYGFDVVPLVPVHKGQPAPAIFEPFHALLVRLHDGGQGMLAWGYPEGLLKALAVALADRANSGLERNGLPAEVQSLAPVVIATGADDSEEDEAEDFDGDEEADEDSDFENGPVTQPSGSQIEIDRFPDGLTIRVPPAGLRKGTRGLFFFSLIWNGFMGVFTSFVGLALWQGKVNDIEGGDWLFGLFIAVFWLVGILMLLGAINMGRRQAALAVAGGQLLVIQTGLFGKKQQEWAAGEVKEITAGPSGMEMNDVPILELQIHDQQGKKVGLLAGRSDVELRWLAWELSQVVQQSKAMTTE